DSLGPVPAGQALAQRAFVAVCRYAPVKIDGHRSPITMVSLRPLNGRVLRPALRPATGRCAHGTGRSPPGSGLRRGRRSRYRSPPTHAGDQPPARSFDHTVGHPEAGQPESGPDVAIGNQLVELSVALVVDRVPELLHFL